MPYGYGWLNFIGSVMDAAHELADLKPEIDIIYCSLIDYIYDGIKGERSRLIASDGRSLYLVPDHTIPQFTIHGVKEPAKPEKRPIEIGSTLA